MSEIRDEKLEQVRISCSTDEGHGSHPRVAVFRRMACWEDDPELDMNPEQETACMQILSWLGIASSDPPDRDMRILLRLKDAQKMIEHLYRLRLVDDVSKKSLWDMTNELRLGKDEISPRHAAAAMCDADALLWRWMEQWGSWEPKVVGIDGLVGKGAAPAPAPAGAPAPSSNDTASNGSRRRSREAGEPAPAPAASSRGQQHGNRLGWRGSTEQAVAQ